MLETYQYIRDIKIIEPVLFAPGRFRWPATQQEGSLSCPWLSDELNNLCL
ncbi:MAG: hypothetical protein AB7M93_07060 [Candidatus Obscuribacterales bacterium]